MADAIRRLDAIDPHACRRSASERFDVAAVAAGYEEGYHEVVSLDGAARNPGDPHPRVADPSVVLPRIDVS